MKSIDNFDEIIPLLRGFWETYTDPISFHVQVLQRKKDGHQVGHNNKIRTIAEWFIYSEQTLLRLKPAIKSLCELYNARCYIAINGKTDEAVLWGIAVTSMKYIKNRQMSFKGMISHVHDTCNGHGIKRWIVDVDDLSIDLEQLISNINLCRSGTPNNNVICQVPTKNGIHLITRPFDLSQIQLPAKVEIKKNNSTLLYYNE